MEEWHHIPETDHIASVDPIDMVISRTAAPNRRKKNAPKDGVSKRRGRKPGPPTYKVRFLPPLTPEESWEGVSWEGRVKWKGY